MRHGLRLYKRLTKDGFALVTSHPPKKRRSNMNLAKNQFIHRAPKRGRRLISVVEITDGIVYYTTEVEFRTRQPLTPGGISIATFNRFFGVNASDFAPAAA